MRDIENAEATVENRPHFYSQPNVIAPRCSGDSVAGSAIERLSQVELQIGHLKKPPEKYAGERHVVTVGRPQNLQVPMGGTAVRLR